MIQKEFDKKTISKDIGFEQRKIVPPKELYLEPRRIIDINSGSCSVKYRTYRLGENIK